MAGPLGVTHFLILSKTDNSVYLVSGYHAFPSLGPSCSCLVMNPLP